MHQLVGVGDLLERHRTPEHRADEPRVDEPVGLVALPRVGEVRADDLLLAHPEVADVEVELVAARRPADDDLPERLDRVDRGRERGATDVLEDDVGRVAEDRLHALGEVARDGEARLLLVRRLAAAAHHPRELRAVDPARGAELLQQRPLLRRGDDADALGPGSDAQLGREDAQAAGGAPDEDAVAGLQPRAVEQHPVGREVRQAVGGGLVPAEVLRLGQQLLGLDLRELREGAPARLVAPDPLRGRGERVEAVDLGVLVGGLVAVQDDLVAGLPARDAGAHLPHDPGGVGAADVMVLLRVRAEDRHRLAQGRPDVVEVHAGGHDADDDLEGRGLGDLDLLDLEGVLGLALALLADDPGGHRGRQLARLGVDAGDLREVDGHGPGA